MSAWILTTELPLYLPPFFDRLLDAEPSRVDRIILASAPPKRVLRQQYQRYGPVDGARMTGLFARGLLLSALSPARQRRLTGSLHSVRSAGAAHDVPVEYVSDITDPAFIDRVAAADPELLLSVLCGQRLGPDLLSIPEWAINLHPSLLPAYRGPAAIFWAMYHDEPETGWTAHEMTESFDDGPIIDQSTTAIEDETLHALTRRLMSTGVEMATGILGTLPNGSFETRPNPATEADYYSAPTADDRREFKRRGNRLL